jgi:methionyl aminopeptidase
MVTIRSEREIELMREAGRIVGETLAAIEREIREGVTTKRLDELAEAYIRSEGASPSFLNYVPKGAVGVKPYPATLCVSINEEIVHGIPNSKRVIRDGDIVSVDCGACKAGYHADAARTYVIGKAEPKVVKLVEVTRRCLALGIQEAVAGKRLYDISAAIQDYAESFGYGVIENLVGHGIGTQLHEEPPVPNIGKRNTGPFLREGMVLAIEPMINLGKAKKAMIGSDTWTAVTADKMPSAHFENTVVVRKGKAEIITLSSLEKERMESNPGSP